MIEVVEHLDPAPLAKLGDVLFGELRPAHVLVTTPNSEYNSVWYPKLPPEKCPLRNNDHRFEWTRAEFRAWAEGLGTLHGYDVRFEGAGGGPFDAMKPAPGPVTQAAIFERRADAPPPPAAAAVSDLAAAAAAWPASAWPPALASLELAWSSVLENACID